jgi:hypothetical protein
MVMMEQLSRPAFAVNSYRVGLKTGDSAFYQLSGNYGFFPDMPMTKMNVLNVFQTNVTAGFTDFFPDGLLSSNVYWVDIFSGQARNASSFLFFAVTPGLELRDPIFNGSGIIITNTQSILCGGSPRSVVVAQFIKSNANMNVAIAWDQNTGALCRLNSSEYSYSPGSQPRSLSMAMTNTTLWSTSSTPPDVFAIAADISAFLGLPLVALIVYVYFQRKRKARRSPGLGSKPVRLLSRPASYPSED